MPFSIHKNSVVGKTSLVNYCNESLSRTLHYISSESTEVTQYESIEDRLYLATSVYKASKGLTRASGRKLHIEAPASYLYFAVNKQTQEIVT